MNFESFWSIFDGAFQYVSNGASFLRNFYNCLPSEVTTFLFSVFVIPFGFMAILMIIRVLK